MEVWMMTKIFRDSIHKQQTQMMANFKMTKYLVKIKILMAKMMMFNQIKTTKMPLIKVVKKLKTTKWSHSLKGSMILRTIIQIKIQVCRYRQVKNKQTIISMKRNKTRDMRSNLVKQSQNKWMSINNSKTSPQTKRMDKLFRKMNLKIIRWIRSMIIFNIN